jgi:hypothetical protein
MTQAERPRKPILSLKTRSSSSDHEETKINREVSAFRSRKLAKSKIDFRPDDVDNQDVMAFANKMMQGAKHKLILA